MTKVENMMKKSENTSAPVCDRNSFVRKCLGIVGFLVLLQLFYSNAIYKKTSQMIQILSNQEIEKFVFTPPAPKSFQKDVICRTSHHPNSSSENATLLCNISSTAQTTKPTDLPLCPEKPPKLVYHFPYSSVGPLGTYHDSPSYKELEKLFPELEPGGRYKPPDCKSRHKVAIILPYRNRDLQLRNFLKNIHPFLERQQLDYGIYVVEQAEGSRFNRAMLMNIGYAEAVKVYDYQCFAFHDVDLIPQDDRNIYNCPNQPRHLSVAIDKFGYRLPYGSIFGGAVLLAREQFQKVNGFSNKFFGWGGEDDDMWNRVKSNGYSVIRYPVSIARYRMIKHGQDKGNEANPQRMALINQGAKRYKTDGINSLKYKVLKLEFRKLYTRVYISVNQSEIMKECMDVMAEFSEYIYKPNGISPTCYNFTMFPHAYLTDYVSQRRYFCL